MDYIKMYYEFCNHCKKTSARERLESRNKFDERLKEDVIYTENHHIIPKHAGGTNEDFNMVVLLPEEHYIAHLIRYNAYKNRNDFLAIRFMVNGFMNHKRYRDKFPNKLKNKLVAKFKSEIYYFRKENSWHSESGIKRLSESRKGKIRVKDSITGELIGEVLTDHPKYITGEYVHHTKGMISVIEIYTGAKKYITSLEYKKNKQLYRPNNGDSRGKNNPKFSGYTDLDLVNFVVDLSKKINNGLLVSYRMAIDYYKNKNEYNLPKSLNNEFRFSGHGFDYKLAESISGLKYDPYYMNNPENRKIIKERIRNLLNN